MNGICCNCKRPRIDFIKKRGICKSCWVSLRQKEKVRYGEIAEEQRIKNRKRFKKWYQKNKQRQYENIKKYQLKNKLKCQSRRNTQNYRKIILNVFNNKCIICGSKKNLEIDHIDYKIKKKELINFVKVLCRLCHRKKHRLSSLNGSYRYE